MINTTCQKAFTGYDYQSSNQQAIEATKRAFKQYYLVPRREDHKVDCLLYYSKSAYDHGAVPIAAVECECKKGWVAPDTLPAVSHSGNLAMPGNAEGHGFPYAEGTHFLAKKCKYNSFIYGAADQPGVPKDKVKTAEIPVVWVQFDATFRDCLAIDVAQAKSFRCESKWSRCRSQSFADSYFIVSPDKCYWGADNLDDSVRAILATHAWMTEYDRPQLDMTPRQCIELNAELALICAEHPVEGEPLSKEATEKITADAQAQLAACDGVVKYDEEVDAIPAADLIAEICRSEPQQSLQMYADTAPSRLKQDALDRGDVQRHIEGLDDKETDANVEAELFRQFAHSKAAHRGKTDMELA